METPVTDPIVAEYLQRLDRAGAVLPPDRRTELVQEIAHHIEQARADGSARDEVSVRTLLDRLGEPDEIVAAAREEGDDVPAPPAGFDTVPQHGFDTVPQYGFRRPGTPREATAVALLTIGSIVPVLGWLVGVGVLWSSMRWRTREKILGTVIVPGGPFAALWLGLVAGGSTETCASAASASDTSTTCTHSGFSFSPWVGLPLLGFCVVAPVAVAIYLYSLAMARAALEPPIPVLLPPNGPARWGGLEITAIVLLSVGGFVVPVVAPVVGLILVWVSPAWTRTEKLVATAIAVGVGVLGLLLAVLLIL